MKKGQFKLIQLQRADVHEKKPIKRMCVYVRAGGNESSWLELSFASKSTTQFLELPAEKSSLPTMVSMAMQSV